MISRVISVRPQSRPSDSRCRHQSVSRNAVLSEAVLKHFVRSLGEKASDPLVVRSQHQIGRFDFPGARQSVQQLREHIVGWTASRISKGDAVSPE